MILSILGDMLTNGLKEGKIMNASGQIIAENEQFMVVAKQTDNKSNDPASLASVIVDGYGLTTRVADIGTGMSPMAPKMG